MSKYPDIEVELIGQDGNAFYILGAVQNAMRKAGVLDTEIDKYVAEATEGDYNNLLRVTSEWIEIV